MDALTAIHTRRSVKRYTSDPVPEEALQKLLEAAYDASSGANRQPREYVVVTDRTDLDRLAEVHRACGWLKSAQAAIAVASDPAKGRYWLEDACVAAQNMWIAATAMGLGIAWSAIYQSDNTEESARRQAAVREILNIPAEINVPIVLGIGMPAGEPDERKRPPLETMVHRGKYQAKIN